MLKAGVGGLLAISMMALASYFYQASMIAHLPADEYALVMIGLGSFLITTALGSAVEVVSAVGHARASTIGLVTLMGTACGVSVVLGVVGMVPIGVEWRLLLPIGFSAAALVFFASSLGAAQATGRWSAYLGMALLYASTYAGLAVVCYDPFFALAIPGLAATVGGTPGLLIRPPHRFGSRQAASTAVRLAPIPLLVNLDLWLVSHWLGPAASAYRVPALLGRPFYYLFGSGLAPAVRRAAGTGRAPTSIALASLTPLAVAPVGFLALAAARSRLPDPWGTFQLDLLAWAVFAQASVATFYLLLNGLGHRAGRWYVVALLWLPIAFMLPPLAQLLVSLTGGALIIGRATSSSWPRLSLRPRVHYSGHRKDVQRPWARTPGDDRGGVTRPATDQPRE